MAKDVRTVAIISFRPTDGPAGHYAVEVAIDGSDPYDGRCQLPPTYDGLPLARAKGGQAEEGVTWRKAGAAPPEDAFQVSDMGLLEGVGAALFDAVFSEHVRGVLETLVQDGVALRFDLTRAPALAQEPFEALFLRRGALFIGTQVRTPVSRLLLPNGAGSGGRDINLPARGLFAIANPGETLDQSGEIEAIRNLKQSAIEWTFMPGLTRKSFTDALRDLDPDIVHFLGHGKVDADGKHFVAFHDRLRADSREDVPAGDFRDMLQNSKASLVVLNSCYSAQASSSDVFAGVAQRLVRNRTPFVVAMRTRISDEAALIFSEAFYAELARFKTPEEAVTLARNAIRTIPSDPARQVEFATPVLYATGRRETLFAPAVEMLPPLPGPPPRRPIFKWVAIGAGGLGILAFGLLVILRPGGSSQAPSNIAASNAAMADNVANAMDEASDMNAMAPANDMAMAGSSYPEMAGPTAAPSFPQHGVSGSRDHSASPDLSGHSTGQPASCPGGHCPSSSPPPVELPPSPPAPPLSPPPPSPLPPALTVCSNGIRVPATETCPPGPPAPTPYPVGGSCDANGACTASAPPLPSPPANMSCPNGAVILATETCPAPPPIGPFIVFFDWDKDEITPAAAAILDNAAAAYQQTGRASVTLAGHADRSGSDAYNVGLSQRRANNVRAYLAGRGVPDGSITTEAYGESRPLVDTADGVREPQNRRVEITFGPGSGW